MIRLVILMFVLTSIVSCKKDSVLTDQTILSNYLEKNSELELDELIACAGGNNTEFMGSSDFPIAVFFYPENASTDFLYFETDSIEIDPSIHSNYHLRNYGVANLFNGTMMKFDHPSSSREKWGIVTYKTAGKIHKCNPIRIKASELPTNDISVLTTITENGVMPFFDWTLDVDTNNVIFFSIVSDANSNLISGTYTYDKFWTFYDLSNVVLNVSTGAPALSPNLTYDYTLMGVSIDNWVHSIAGKSFSTL